MRKIQTKYRNPVGFCSFQIEKKKTATPFCIDFIHFGIIGSQQCQAYLDSNNTKQVGITGVATCEVRLHYIWIL